MPKPVSIKNSLNQLEKLSGSLNIAEDQDSPTLQERFVFWKIQSNLEDRLHARKRVNDVQHDAELSLF
jgi:hypothetical protein